MSNLSDPIPEVRVHPAGTDWGREETEVQPRRSAAQQAQDYILDTAEAKLREARDAMVEGAEMMGVVMVPQHQHIDRLIGQLIEQLIEYRRVKS